MSKRPSRSTATARTPQPAGKPTPRSPRARLWTVAIAILVLIAAGLTWQLRRRAAPLPAPAAPSAADPQEARLQQAVHSRPRDPQAREALAAYYQESGQPFAALGELAVLRDLGTHEAGLSPRMAQALRAAGLPDAALRLLSESGSAERSSRLAAARLHLETAEPEAALSLLRRDPTAAASPDGRLLLAQASLAAEDLPAARAALHQFRQQFSGATAEQRVVLGRLALAAGDRAQAQEWLSEAARDNPADEPAQYYAGMAFVDSNPEKAVEYFKAATQADPRQVRAGLVLARLLYEKSGQWERAADVYRQALKIEPQSRDAEAGLARALVAVKQTDQALYHQARVRELEDRPDQALPLYRRWGERNPERWDSVLRAAECWMDQQRYVEAAQEVRRGLQRFPDHPELFGHLAQLYLRTGDRPEAARLYEQWARVDTDTGRPEWVRGQLAAQALKGDEAVRWFEAAIRKNPQMGVYHTDLAKELARQPTPERLQHARDALERAAALIPGSDQVHAQLGQVLQALGDPEGARRAFLRALDREPVRLDAYRGLMAVTRQLGHPRAAAFFARLERQVRDWERDETSARRKVAARSTDATARLDLARLLLRHGRLPEAGRHLAVAAGQPGGAPARPLLRRVQRLLEVL
jgi:tetratricopeptide (TPR) repeat protein